MVEKKSTDCILIKGKRKGFVRNGHIKKILRNRKNKGTDINAWLDCVNMPENKNADKTPKEHYGEDRVMVIKKSGIRRIRFLNRESGRLYYASDIAKALSLKTKDLKKFGCKVKTKFFNTNKYMVITPEQANSLLSKVGTDKSRKLKAYINNENVMPKPLNPNPKKKRSKGVSPLKYIEGHPVIELDGLKWVPVISVASYLIIDPAIVFAKCKPTIRPVKIKGTKGNTKMINEKGLLVLDQYYRPQIGKKSLLEWLEVP